MGYSPKEARQPPYSGKIHFERVEFASKVQSWIRKHNHFASEEWLEGKIIYENWLPDGNKPDHFYVLVRDYDGIKPIRVIIKFIYYPNSHVYVYRRPHVL